MRSWVLISFTLLITACTAEQDHYTKWTGFVRISEVEIPDTSYYPEIVHIRATAEANNGCWRDLHFALEKETTFEYSLKATGTFESYGACPEMMVCRDTVIDFVPGQRGTYIIRSFSDVDEFMQDSLCVK